MGGRRITQLKEKNCCLHPSSSRRYTIAPHIITLSSTTPCQIRAHPPAPSAHFKVEGGAIVDRAVAFGSTRVLYTMLAKNNTHSLKQICEKHVYAQWRGYTSKLTKTAVTTTRTTKWCQQAGLRRW